MSAVHDRFHPIKLRPAHRAGKRIDSMGISVKRRLVFSDHAAAQPIWKRALLWFFRIVIGLGSVRIPLMLAVRAYPPLILASPGRVSSAYCTPRKAFFESKVLLDQQKIEDRIRGAAGSGNSFINDTGKAAVKKPFGRYYLYFAHHAGKFIPSPTWVSHGSGRQDWRLPASTANHRGLAPHRGCVCRFPSARRSWLRLYRRG